ncbi:hypothetical protein M3484_19675 [Pseudomonas sp. GX19020]|uniref:hypothetical protein n=1 Tax=Pseudomonas sp. GX19020 TaxID=2942277 RepID=UPI002019C3DF|nr:hypothetical protein [Pseudomonas sp. GX19020]MCL4068787.1 hypothetical protein [Pseudomonas sp. GX19020]
MGLKGGLEAEQASLGWRKQPSEKSRSAPESLTPATQHKLILAFISERRKMSEKLGYGAYFRTPLDDEDFVIIGKIVTQLAMIERIIDFGIMRFSGLTSEWSREVLTSRNGTSSKIQILLELLKIDAEEDANR